MNTITLNMTTLDGGSIIKKDGGGGGVRINNQDKVVDITENGTTEVVADGGFTGLGKVTINTEVSGGGGADLEGEYFLAKPNGRYWKLNFITYSENGALSGTSWDSLNEEQHEMLPGLYMDSLADLGFVYTCVGQKVRQFGLGTAIGLYYTTYGKIQSNLGYSVGRMVYDSNKNDLFSCVAWQEAYPNLPSELVEVLPEGMEITSIFDYLKLIIMSELGYAPSDEETYAMLSEMFMTEPMTKDEYEDLVSRSKDEDY